MYKMRTTLQTCEVHLSVNIRIENYHKLSEADLPFSDVFQQGDKKLMLNRLVSKSTYKCLNIENKHPNP